MSPPQSSRPFDGTDALIKAFEKLYDSQENHIGQLQASLNILHQNFGILKNSSVKHQLRLESLANSLTNNLKHVAVLSKNCHNTQKLLMRFSARNQATAEPAVTEKSEEASNNYVDDTTPEQASRDRSKPPPIILPNHDKTFQEEESVIDIVPLAQGIPGVMDSNLSCWATEPTISEQKAPEQKVVAEPLNPEITLAKSQSNTTKFTSIDGTMVIKYAKTAEPQPILEPRGLNRSLWAPRTRATVVPVNLPTKEPTSNNFAEKFAAAAAKFSIKIGPVVMSSQQTLPDRSAETVCTSGSNSTHNTQSAIQNGPQQSQAGQCTDSPSIWDNLETFEEEVKAVKRKDENSQPAQLVYETEKVIEH